MCGICGIAGESVDGEDTVRLMNDRLFHRGPDSAGHYFTPHVQLAMRRLAIIDRAGSEQPLYNETKSLALVFNGEIYNYRELRRRLVQAGHTLQTGGDAECVVHLYEQYGVECLAHLEGQFAFALWDSSSRVLFLARDRLGEKPLYYSLHSGRITFASELHSLYAALDRRPQLDLQAIDLYLAHQYVPEPFCVYQGIQKLPAGHYLLFSEGAAQIRQYWQPEYLPKHTASEVELTAELHDLVLAAVSRCLVSDVPLGAHLSGGIDSSIVVAMMAQNASAPIKTFSAGFAESGFSELEYARLVAQRYGTEHHEFQLEYGNVPDTLDLILRHVGEPMADSSMLPLYHLCRLTRQHVTVALNGDGGDEIMAGYLRHRMDGYADWYLRAPFPLRRAAAGAADLFSDNADKPIGASVINGLKRLRQLSAVDSRASILRWSSYFQVEHRRTLWQPEALSQIRLDQAERLLAEMYESAPAQDKLDRTLYTDIRTYLPGALLVKSDRMAMANSLEGRSPFLNHHLVEWTARLPVHYKLRGSQGKYLLRRAFQKYIPPEILNRPKRGFGVPVNAWLRKPLRKWSEEVLLDSGGTFAKLFKQQAVVALLRQHHSGREDHGRRIWALLTLAMWLKQTHDAPSAGTTVGSGRPWGGRDAV